MIGIVINRIKQGAAALRDEITASMQQRGMDYHVFIDAQDVAAYPDPIDCLIVVGGDGSILRYAEVASEKETPILGINIGRIGFLAEVTDSQIDIVLDRLQRGDYSIEKRMMLACRVNDGPEWHCLNDVLVFKRSFSGVTQMEVAVNGYSLGSVFCDGMIAATPTGSTGYSLSAGGPVLVPDMEAVVLSPVCSHTLHIRPTVAGADADISFTLQADGIVSVDGIQKQDVAAGDVVRVVRSPRATPFVRFFDEDVFRLIREKLR